MNARFGFTKGLGYIACANRRSATTHYTHVSTFVLQLVKAARVSERSVPVHSCPTPPWNNESGDARSVTVTQCLPTRHWGGGRVLSSPQLSGPRLSHIPRFRRPAAPAAPRRTPRGAAAASRRAGTPSRSSACRAAAAPLEALHPPARRLCRHADGRHAARAAAQLSEHRERLRKAGVAVGAYSNPGRSVRREERVVHSICLDE